MKVEKAIEIIDLNIRQRSQMMPPDVLDALKLGSEALKLTIRLHQQGILKYHELMPGED